MQRMLYILLASVIFSYSCKKESEPLQKPTDNGGINDSTQLFSTDTTKLYIPLEFRSIDFRKAASTWSYARCRQSEHFIVYWAKGYGKFDPNSDSIPAAYRVNIDDLLQKVESFYDININKLKFAQTGAGKSKLDKYKMQIYLFYQTDWMAFGAGYDDVIGALWVSPNTCQPVGSVIAHEIGHSFQYQTFCDIGGTSGFRYGFGGNGGNTFWEQTAQWQSFQSYPEQVFDNNFNDYKQNCHRHICHEAYRYASYFIHYYWADKHGIDIVGKIWRGAKQPEDPIQAYMRITGITVEQFNDEIYDAAKKFVTWDIDAIRLYGANFIGAQNFKCNTLVDGSYQVTYDRCPGTTGYNVIPLNVPAAGTEVSTNFTGMVNDTAYNQVASPARAGWRYGFVALLQNGTRTYGTMETGASKTVTFTVPANCSKLWFVVTGAPNTYAPHAWDENEKNDDQWPYKVKFTNTDLLGNVTFDGTETVKDTTLTLDVSFPVSSSDYIGANISFDIVKLAKAFVLQPSAIASQMGKSISFYGVESNGTLNAKTTANGYGHWFDAAGNICAWGTTAKVFSEYDASKYSFTIGQYPGHCVAGNKFTIKQALVYQYETGKTVKATFVININIQ